MLLTILKGGKRMLFKYKKGDLVYFHTSILDIENISTFIKLHQQNKSPLSVSRVYWGNTTSKECAEVITGVRSFFVYTSHLARG